MSVDKRKALIAGTFDPITVGHEDVIRRAADIFEEVYVAVVVNNSKMPFFSIKERVDFCERVFADNPKIKVVSDDGLISELAETLGCGTVVKGLRNTNDFVYEYELSQIYEGMNPSLETVFIPAKGKYMHVSSSAVKAISKLGGDSSFYVPECIYNEVYNKLKNNGN